MSYFPDLKKQLTDTTIKVGNGISIIAEFRYWFDTDNFCKIMTTGTDTDDWNKLFVWDTEGKPHAVWQNGLAKWSGNVCMNN